MSTPYCIAYTIGGLVTVGGFLFGKGKAEAEAPHPRMEDRNER